LLLLLLLWLLVWSLLCVLLLLHRRRLISHDWSIVDKGWKSRSSLRFFSP
jgi:hypothetical protein